MSIDIQVECPACNQKGKIDVPLNLIVETEKGTITIDVPPEVVCCHAFQVFLDKNANVRGYQKVDFQLGKTKSVPQAAGFSIVETAGFEIPARDVVAAVSPAVFLCLLKGLLLNFHIAIACADDEIVGKATGFFGEKFPSINSAALVKNIDLLGPPKGVRLVVDLNFSQVMQDPSESKFTIGQELLKDLATNPDPISQRILFNNFVGKIYRDYDLLVHILEEDYKLKLKNVMRALEEQIRGKIDKSREQFLFEMLKWHRPDLLKHID